MWFGTDGENTFFHALHQSSLIFCHVSVVKYVYIQTGAAAVSLIIDNTHTHTTI